MKCPTCQTDNREGVKFCEACGEKMELTCPGCRARIPLGKKFCGECGQRLEPEKAPALLDNPASSDVYTPKFMAEKILTTKSAIEGERKMVTVLFADVAGFTNLSEKLDPEEVHEVMDGCFRILMEEIHRYEGTINQFTGDGVMSLFGAPLTQEDHAQRACYAALAIQQSMRDYSRDIKERYDMAFEMRIGLNSGPVVVGAIGDDLRMDYTAIGDTTNLGARMESMADPGTINVSENTHRLAGTYFKFRSKGKVPVKGKAEPQSVYQLIDIGDVETRLDAAANRGLSPYIGYGAEIAVLNQAFEKSRSGSGQIIGIIGEAGAGKSRLYLEFCQSLDDAPQVFEGRCLQYGRSIPFLPFLNLLKACLRIKDRDGETTPETNISTRLAQIDDALLTDLSAFEDLLSLEVTDPVWNTLDPKEKRTRYFEAVRNLVLKMSDAGPLVLALDDLQWMDKTSVGLLDYLIGWVANAPILTILMYRPEFTHAWGSRSFYRQLIIEALSPEQSGELIQSILPDGEVGSDLKNLIRRRTEGNPLYIEELTRTLLESNVIEKQRDRYRLTGSGTTDQIPDTVRGIIAARIDRLEDNIKQTIQLAAVIGKDFSFSILQTITGMESELKSYLLQLQSLEFIYEKHLFPELEYIFRHSLTQEVAYGSLLQQKRRIIHQQIGEIIENRSSDNPEELLEVLAFHYNRSPNHEKAYRFSRQAGDKAIGSHSAWEALDYYQQAVDALKRFPKSGDVQKKKLEVMHLMIVPVIVLGFPITSLSVLKQGLQLAKQLGDKKSLIRFYSNLGLYHANRGEHAESLNCSGKAFAAAEKTRDVRSMAQTGPDVVLARLAFGQFQKAYQVAFKVLKRIEETDTETETFGGPANVYPTMLAIAGYCQAVLGNFGPATRLCKKSVEQASAIGRAISMGLCENYFGLVLLNQGDPKPAKKHFEKSIEHLEQVHFLQPLAMALSGLAVAEAFEGNPNAGIEHSTTGLKIIKDSGSSWHLSQHLLNLGICLYFAGNLDEGLERAKQALQSAKNQNETYMEGRTRAWMGRMLIHIDDSQAQPALDHLKRALDIFQKMATQPDIAMNQLFLGEYFAGQTQTQKAQEALWSAKTSFQKMKMAFWLRQTDTALQLLS